MIEYCGLGFTPDQKSSHGNVYVHVGIIFNLYVELLKFIKTRI